MTRSTLLVLAVPLAAGLLGAVLFVRAARGDNPRVSPEVARKKLNDAVEHGRDLWSKPWVEGQKACIQCHGQGPNRMRSVRLKEYPKYDPDADRVITGQQKMREMIEEKARGKAPDLGSDDLNALEAYISTLR